MFSSSMLVIINERPSKDFKVTRGLRQGVPLSPFFFALVVEGLVGIVRKDEDMGEFKGFKINNYLSYGFLQFVDDIILVGECEWNNLWTIKSILRGYELVSGLRVNMFKSKLYGLGIRPRFLQASSHFLLCRVDLIPFKFLGLIVGVNPRKVKSWKSMVATLRKRLANWNNRFLSIGVRVTLLNSVLNNLPVYQMSFYKIP